MIKKTYLRFCQIFKKVVINHFWLLQVFKVLFNDNLLYICLLTLLEFTTVYKTKQSNEEKRLNKRKIIAKVTKKRGNNICNVLKIKP